MMLLTRTLIELTHKTVPQTLMNLLIK